MPRKGDGMWPCILMSPVDFSSTTLLRIFGCVPYGQPLASSCFAHAATLYPHATGRGASPPRRERSNVRSLELS